MKRKAITDKIYQDVKFVDGENKGSWWWCPTLKHFTCIEMCLTRASGKGYYKKTCSRCKFLKDAVNLVKKTDPNKKVKRKAKVYIPSREQLWTSTYE